MDAKELASVSASAVEAGAFSEDDVLLPYQRRWIADESVLKIAEKSRRTGVTWAEAADAVLHASLSRTDGGCDHFYVGSSKDMAREFIDAAAMWARAFSRVASSIQEEVFEDGEEEKGILTYVIEFSSGFKIKALSSNPRNLRGMQGNVTIDEAAFHERLAEVLKAALALTMWGAKVRLISTHNGVDNLFNELIKDSRAGRKRYSIHTITLDDACREGLYRRICQVSRQLWTPEKEAEWKANLLRDTATEDDAQEEYFCVPKQSGGAYIPRPLLDRAARPEHVVLRFTSPKGWLDWTENQRTREAGEWCKEVLLPELAKLNPDLKHSFGEDFARVGDLTVFSVGEIAQNTARRMRITIELHNVTYNQQREIMLFILLRIPRLCGMAFDATGNGGYLAEAALLRFGASMVECVQLSDAWYREWMPKYKALYEANLIEIPQNEEIITDQRHIQVIRGVPKIDKSRTETSGGIKRHGDSAVSYCMCVRASYMEGCEIAEFVGVGVSPESLAGADSLNARGPQYNHLEDFNDDYNEFDRGCW